MSQKLLELLVAKHGDAVEAATSIYGDEVIYVKRDLLIPVATMLRDDPALAFDAPVFVTCTDLLDWAHRKAPSGVDLPRTAEGDPVYRFEVSYQLRSTVHRHRLRVKIRVSESDPKVPTLTGVWPGFDWQERETYDLYGIEFTGHHDLRRIYLYDEFVGHPLRRDYPKEKRQPLVRRDDLATAGVRKGEM